jgi:hypothetical protein
VSAGLLGHGFGRVHHHAQPAPVDEALVAEQLALAPLFDRLSRILGQVAGLLLLSGAGLDAERLSSHLAAVKDQLAEAREALTGLRTPRRLPISFKAAGNALSAMEEFTRRLAKRPGGTLGDDAEFKTALDRMAAIRAQLLTASAPSLGIGLVDFASACCAWGY